MNESPFKRRAILVDFNLLTLNNGQPNYFVLKLCDNIEVAEYSDLIVLATIPQEAREWLDHWCVGSNLVYRTNYDLADDIKHIKETHKSIGAIVSSRFSFDGVNQRLVQIMKIVGR